MCDKHSQGNVDTYHHSMCPREMPSHTTTKPYCTTCFMTVNQMSVLSLSPSPSLSLSLFLQLEYAQLDIQPSVKQAPPSKGSNYVDIRYD